jgi:hypothetical protein
MVSSSDVSNMFLMSSQHVLRVLAPTKAPLQHIILQTTVRFFLFPFFYFARSHNQAVTTMQICFPCGQAPCDLVASRFGPMIQAKSLLCYRPMHDGSSLNLVTPRLGPMFQAKSHLCRRPMHDGSSLDLVAPRLGSIIQAMFLLYHQPMYDGSSHL